MAKGQYLSSHQKGIVRRYYTHRETLLLTKLQEAVTELFLAEKDPASAKMAAKRWKWVKESLISLGVEAGKAASVAKSRKPTELAAAITSLMGPRQG